jgi:hypothetical protein
LFTVYCNKEVNIFVLHVKEMIQMKSTCTTRATLLQNTPVTKAFDRDMIGDMLWAIPGQYLDIL